MPGHDGGGPASRSDRTGTGPVVPGPGSGGHGPWRRAHGPTGSTPCAPPDLELWWGLCVSGRSHPCVSVCGGERCWRRPGGSPCSWPGSSHLLFPPLNQEGGVTGVGRSVSSTETKTVDRWDRSTHRGRGGWLWGAGVDSQEGRPGRPPRLCGSDGEPDTTLGLPHPPGTQVLWLA